MFDSKKMVAFEDYTEKIVYRTNKIYQTYAYTKKKNIKKLVNVCLKCIILSLVAQHDRYGKMKLDPS